MNVAAWILFGLIAGVISNVIDPSPSLGGLIGAVVLGISGALVGGFLGTLLFGTGITGFNISSFIVAISGSLIVIFVSKAFQKA